MRSIVCPAVAISSVAATGCEAVGALGGSGRPMTPDGFGTRSCASAGG